MITYAGIEFDIEEGSFTEIPDVREVTHHFIDTDHSISIGMGRGPTRIGMVILAYSYDEAVSIREVLHRTQEENLHIHDRYYYKRVTSKPGNIKYYDPENEVWSLSAEFKALDPAPYDLTGGALY